MKLQDKVVVVTGSGNGIGEAFARRFTAEGAKVVVTDIEAEACARVAREIGGVGLACDITREDGVQAVADLLVRGIDAERFLILSPGSALLEGLAAKAADYDGWIASHAPVVSG